MLARLFAVLKRPMGLSISSRWGEASAPARLPHGFVAIGGLLAVGVMAGCGGSDREAASSDRPVIEDPGPVHVHGLGINPKDQALFIATHTGLFRAAKGEAKAKRVRDRYQDTMGFTVVGPDRFLGSGHPDLREKLPPFLGLIESSDAGGSWRPISLQGDADFHVLEAAGKRVYGYGSDYKTREERLLVSDDRGRAWVRRSPPEPLVDIAIDPGDSRRLMAAGESGLYRSADEGRRWGQVSRRVGLLAWPQPRRAFLILSSGAVLLSPDAGASWRVVGRVGGRPAAFTSHRNELYAALHDGTVKLSIDGGRSWEVRSTP